ncbi:hypothetical protein ABZ876_08085 [Streptomyces sp. NPDC046931]|uniref:hypothetical protein n=1 Tax=Streptomyces sp. NPDC046931 TaxID=3154806 RepID=UPI0033EC07B8
MSAPTPDYPLDEFDRITATVPMLSAFRVLWNWAEELLKKEHPHGFEPAEIGRTAFDCLPEEEREQAMDELFYAYWERTVDAREARARAEAAGGAA